MSVTPHILKILADTRKERGREKCGEQLYKETLWIYVKKVGGEAG
jgi:hypothetical protein